MRCAGFSHTHSIKLCGLLDYVYAVLWEHVFNRQGLVLILSEYWVQSYICCGEFSKSTVQNFKSAWGSNLGDVRSRVIIQVNLSAGP